MSDTLIIVDRIENGIAVCEKGGALIDVPLSKISSGVREGDVLTENEDGTFYLVNSVETEKRRVDVSARFERLKARKKQV